MSEMRLAVNNWVLKKQMVDYLGNQVTKQNKNAECHQLFQPLGYG
jgi:hypothetical protein